ncbi:MAG TPA: efflux RND transporter periplasmic adaptor subunit [Anaerolineaceae bacterium]|nr:efflux RND transporter periplasmic adaptor subunit [Anaerolineaceae bacterium]
MNVNLQSAKKKIPFWKKKTTLFIALGVVLVAGGLAYFFWNNSVTNASAANATPTINTAVVQRGNIEVSATASGTLSTSDEANLSFPISGTVGELDVKLGDKVTKGQVLAKLSNQDQLNAAVANAQLAVIQDQQALTALTTNAQVNLANAYQAYVTAQTAYTTAQKNQQASTGARCSKEVNTQNLQKLTAAQQTLDQLSLTQPGSQSWIDAKNAYDQANANYQYCITYTSDEITSANSALNVAKVTLDQDQLTYNTLKNNNGIDPNTLQLDQAKLNQAQVQLANAQQNLQGATLIAPINGTVVSIAAGVGQMYNASTNGAAYITIADLDHPTINVSVAEADMSQLAIGNVADVVFDALPNRTFTGKVVQANAQLTTSGGFQVVNGQVALDQPITDSNGQQIPLGLDCTVTLISKQANNVLILPLTAVRDLGGGQYAVFVVGPNSKLTLKLVQVGIQDANNIEITSGLQEGDVVSTGTMKINSGRSTNSSGS